MTPDEKMDQILNDIRSEPLDPAAEDAAGRVWDRLAAGGSIRGCADFQALAPDFHAGRLPEARALLLQDHLNQCVACRRVMSGETPRVIEIAPRVRRRLPRWAVAAAVVLTAGAVWPLWNRFGPAPEGDRAVLESSYGLVYRVSDAQALAAGAGIAEGVEIRTAKDAVAFVRLRDGSLVEMRERSGLSVEATRRDLTVRAGLGSIIVQAAKRRTGRLHVATRDTRAWVTGTTFGVSSGTKGSRVAVVEGQVRVGDKTLRAGDQYQSSPHLDPVSVADEIAWSRNAAAHLTLLREFQTLEQQIAQQVRMPGLRYQSELLNLLPADTVVFASLPNLGETLAQANQIFRQRMQDSPVLRQWWEKQMRGDGPKFDEIIARVRAVSEYLGDEIVIGARLNHRGQLDEPVFLAQVKRDGFRQYVDGIAEMKNIPLRIENNVAIVGAGNLTGGLANTAFGGRIREAFRDGAGIVFSADLAQLATEARDVPGFNQLQHVVVEQSGDETRAVVTFNGPRQGVAAWLASPAPLGALDFVSAEANLAAGFVLLNPQVILDEILKQAGSTSHLAEVEAKLGVNLRNDIVAALGAQAVVALDGPALPPSWKLIVEVYDPSRLQFSLQRVLDGANRELAAHSQPQVRLAQETANGRVYYTVTVPAARVAPEIHYLYADGYLIAAPSRALLDRALQNRANGLTLSRSQKFTSLLPRDGYNNFSGVFYQNIGSALSGFAEQLGPGVIPAELGQLKPSLIAAYAVEDRITVASTGGLLGFSPANLLGSPLAMLGMLEKQGTRGKKPAYR
ncbi:MAG: FecR domain-containing protein [Bryobacteraceae bacterium]